RAARRRCAHGHGDRGDRHDVARVEPCRVRRDPGPRHRHRCVAVSRRHRGRTTRTPRAALDGRRRHVRAATHGSGLCSLAVDPDAWNRTRVSAHGGKVRFGAFYRRRAMRLLPALVFFLAIFLLYVWLTDLPGAHEPSSALSILFYYS